MNATPPPDNSLSDRNAVAPLPPVYPMRTMIEPAALSANPEVCFADRPDLLQKVAEAAEKRRTTDADRKAFEEAIGADPGPPDLNPVIRILANAKDDLKELNDRLAERTQAFLERERQLLDRLRLAEAALQETIYAEVTGESITYTTLDRRVVGRRDIDGNWDLSLPLRGQVKISADRPEN